MKFASLLGLALLSGLSLLAPGARAQEAKAPAAAAENTVHVIIKTSMGDMALELNKDKAPISTENFLAYADKKFYDGTIFHRVIPNFMIQGGGFAPDMTQKKAEKPIKNEWKNGLKNARGTVAMARLGGNADSATCQFFINVNDNAFLDEPRDGAGYAVFGRVVDGLDVMDKIKGVKTGSKGGMQDVPDQPVMIKEVRRMTAEESAALKSKLSK